MQDLFYDTISSNLYVTTEKGTNYTIPNVTLAVKEDIGSFVAVSGSVDVAFFPIKETNLHNKKFEEDKPEPVKKLPTSSSFYWNFNTGLNTGGSPINYAVITGSSRTYVNQDSISNEGMFNIPSGSSINIKMDSNHAVGQNFNTSIIDKTINRTIINQSYTELLTFDFVPTELHYYEIRMDVINT